MSREQFFRDLLRKYDLRWLYAKLIILALIFLGAVGGAVFLAIRLIRKCF